jgi:spore coat polysaccharide biosynthesis predicted glycosyltransferase SpsG
MIVFRTDASQKTGLGHLKRSTYLASLLKNKCNILFCVNKDKTVTRILQEKRVPCCYLKELQRQKLKNPSIKSIVFDLKHFSNEDIQLIRQAKNRYIGPIKTVQITDLGLSQQDVDYTIDASIEQLFPYSEDKQKKLLCGPDYAILHTHFRHFHKIKRKYRQKIKNLFVCFGGGVTYRRLRNAIDLLSRYRFDIKIAPGFYLKKSYQKVLRRIYPGIRFVGNTESLARSFFEADVAVVTAGLTAFEAAAAGTPALYFYYHKEQECIARAFEKKGAGLEISHIDNFLKVNVIEKINELNLEKRIEMGNKGKQLVNAKGVYRIIDFFERNGII